MAYIIGLLTDREQTDLISKGYQLERPPLELIPYDCPEDMELKMIWVDSNVLDILSSNDLEK